MKTTSFLWTLTLAMVLSACATEQAQKTNAAKQPAAANADVQKLEKPEKGEGTTIKVYRDRSKSELSLLDAVKATGKKVAIFQFAGVECLSCFDESKEIEAKIKASPKGKDIAHIVVITDLFKDYKDEEFKEFMTKYAPNGTAVYDEAKLWKRYSADPKSPDRATILAMNLDQEFKVSTEPGQQMTIISAAEALVK